MLSFSSILFVFLAIQYTRIYKFVFFLPQKRLDVHARTEKVVVNIRQFELWTQRNGGLLVYILFCKGIPIGRRVRINFTLRRVVVVQKNTAVVCIFSVNFNSRRKVSSFHVLLTHRMRWLIYLAFTFQLRFRIVLWYLFLLIRSRHSESQLTWFLLFIVFQCAL